MMTKQTKYILIAIGVVLVIFIFRRSNKNTTVTTTSNPYTEPSQPAPSTGTGSIKSKYFPLRRGSKNNYVGALQRFLNNYRNISGANTLVVDNIFGSKTQSALGQYWEAKHGFWIPELNELQYETEMIYLYE
ncbi:MAG: hypothetical protein UIQ67_05945 [Bacteroidales bacterium]|nr:hypothetical protein [Bacteroidales bacterium]